MNNDELIGIIEHELEHAGGAEDSQLSENRTMALDYYRGEAKGKLAAREGKSSVVDTVLADSIEWMMPQLLDTFIGEEVLRFDPESSQDEQQAQDESDACNYVIMKQNDPYTLWNTAFRDCLLQKNAVNKIYWDDTKSTSQETYENLNMMEFQQLVEDPDVEILEQEQILPEGMMEEQLAMLPPEQSMQLISFNVRIMRTERGVCIDNVPLDNFRYSDDLHSTNLDKARFLCHDSLRTVSDLIEDGFDRNVVEELPAYEEEDDEEDYAREMGDWENEADGNTDISTRKIRVYEIYLRVDAEDTGVARLYQIFYAGKKILSMEEADSHPFAAGAAIPQGHIFEGLSLYDRLKDVMEQKTVTWRQVLDNMYQVNNTRHVAVRGKVNLDDLLNNRIGGVIRAKDVASPAEAVMPLPVQPMFQHGYTMLEYLDKMSEARSGVGANFMGQNQALSNDTAHGIERVMSAGEMLVGNIKRALAETIVKGTYLKVRELLMKHQEREMSIPSKEDAIIVNPSSWRKRDKTTIKVGLGTGDRMKQMAAMQQVLMFQEKLAIGGRDDMITPQKVFNALEDFGTYAGLQDVAQYFVDPSSMEGQQIAQQKAQQQPPPDPNMMLVEVEKQKAEGQMMKAQADAQNKQADQQVKMQELQMKQLEMQIKERELSLKEQELNIKVQEMNMGADVDRYKIDTDAAIEQAKLEKEREDTIIELQKERERLQADLEKQTVEVQRIQTETTNSSKTEAQPVPEIHIHNGGAKRVVVNRTANGLEGVSEPIGDAEE